MLRKWSLNFPNDFDVIVVVAVDCLLYACKALNGYSARLCFCPYEAALYSNSGN